MTHHRMIAAIIVVRHLTGTGRVRELAEATLELEDAKAEYDKRCAACNGFGMFLNDDGPAPVETICDVCEGTGNWDADEMGVVWQVEDEIDE